MAQRTVVAFDISSNRARYRIGFNRHFRDSR
jgi:hypothetical protein